MTSPPIGHLVECDQCHASTVVADGRNVHDALSCACCGDDHVHAAEDGTTASSCRSVTITVGHVRAG